MIKDGKEIVQDGMMGYSAYVLLQRAIPSLEDGLKISYRRILYSMHHNRINTFTKSQNVAGEVSKIHPHGSQYQTMVGMAQRDRHIYPFIEGKGYFGEYTSRDVTAAAERYTNVRMNEYGKYLLKDIHKEQVNFSPSYDGTQELPDLLPVKFPMILAFAQSGMGVGFSSTTASHNIPEVADTVIEYLKTGKVNTLIPDFATGGLMLYDDNVIDRINKEGRGSIKIRAAAEIDGRTISITEIPYSTTREVIIDKVVELAKTDILKEVVNIQDLTGLNRMEILVTARKGTDMEILLEKLYKLTTLEATYSVNSTVLYDDRPRLMGTREILIKWVDWRRQCIKKEIAFDIRELEKDRVEISALKKISKDIDFVVSTVRHNNKTKAVELIRNKFGITFNQSEYIYSLHLRQLNDGYIKKQLEKLKKIESRIDELNNLEEDEVIIGDMNDYKKLFNAARRTQIIDVEEIAELKKEAAENIREELVDDSQYWVTITENHYIYKTVNKTIKLKGDKIIGQYKMNNAVDEVFTYMKDRARGYKIQIRDIELYNGRGLGDYLPALLGIDKAAIDSYGIASENYPVIILILTSGRVVKFSYESYRSGVKVFSNTHTEQYDISHSMFLEDDIELELTDTEGNINKINTKDVRITKSRTGAGQFIHSSRRLDISKVK